MQFFINFNFKLNFNLGDEVKNLSTCEFEGKKYKEGERMYPVNDQCYKCLCTKDFENKPAPQNKNCEKISCNIEMLDSQYVKDNCAPVYHNNSCCPYDWRCPNKNDAIIPGDRKFINQPGSKCKFGKLEFEIGDSLSLSQNSCSKCSCTSPPWLNCVYSPC